MADHWRQAGFGLYVHWPFCAAKCPYCDFNSHVAQKIDQTAWQQAYLQEIARIGALTSDKVLSTIFFGGGTPSLMDPDCVATVIDTARKTWRCSNDMEITLEANPGSVEAGRFAAYRDGGVNRISLGVQALNNTDLKRLGRIHTAKEACAAFDIARKTFDRVSFDLIYARQDQSLQAWTAELKQALEMAVDHLSLYQLTVEDGTAFGDRFQSGGLRGLPADDLAADLYDATQEICAAAGLPAYEISNHARPGSESRHNLIYWRGGDYAGIGPGAHGRLTLNGARYATEAPKAPGQWLNSVNGDAPAISWSRLTHQDQANEYLMMCSRLTEGLDVDHYRDISGQNLDPASVAELVDLGMIHRNGNRLQASAQGRLVLNSVIAALMPDDR